MKKENMRNPINPNSLLANVDDAEYRRLRWQILITTFMSYAIFYISRKNFSAAAPALKADLGMTDIQYGLIGTIWGISYGLSKFGSGLLADNVNPRKMIGPALISIGLLNFLMASSTHITMLAIVYIITAIVQGSGFPPIAKAMSYWYSKQERGMWYSFWNASHNVGGALAPLIAAGAIAYYGDWRYAFYIPGAIALAMGIVAVFFMRDKPEAYGLPSIGEWKQDTLELAQCQQSEDGLCFWKMIEHYILRNPTIWIAILGASCIYIIRPVINDWTAIYYTDVLGWDQFEANSLVAWFEIGGLIGGIGAGFLSDLLFKSNRWMTCLLFTVILGISILLLPFLQHSNYLISAFLFSLMGAGIYGPQLLFALGIIETTHKDAAGSATGFKGLFTYLALAATGYPIAKLKEIYSWDSVFYLMLAVILLLILSLLLLLKMTKEPRFK